jgi:ketosteroid isomerase-like protein
MSAIEQAFRATNRRFETEVIGEGRLDRLRDVYTEDATVMPPDGPIIEGIDAITAYWTSAVAASGIRQIKLTTKDILVSPSFAHEIGTAIFTVAPGGEAESVVPVKYVVIWKLGPGGQWRWYVDIWNAFKS